MMGIPVQWALLLVIGLAGLFYAAIPGIGAFLARGQWRRFRRTIVEVSRLPTVNPSRIAREKTGFLGSYRFFGTLEAIQGDERIWITNGRQSVAADLSGLSVHILPQQDARPENGRETEMRSVPWGRIFSLPEGTPILVGGALFSEDGRGVFRSRGRDRLLVVIHDCPRESIIQRATWSGRHRNEYANALTLPSLVTGSLSLALLAYSLLAVPGSRIAAIAAITGSIGPLVPFLPPGFPLYFAYRRFWKRARLLRAQRDVVRLPLRYFPAESVDSRPGDVKPKLSTLLPDMEPYIMLRGALREGATPILATGGMEIELPAAMERIELVQPKRWKKRDADQGGCVVFGSYREEGEGIVLAAPEDPMAQLILVPGDPQSIARECSRAARGFEILSAVLIVLDLAINAPLVFLVLSLFVG